jgi:hypothetical protein
MWDIHKGSKQDLRTEVGAFLSPGWVSREVADDRSNESFSVLNADAGGFYEGS